MCLKLFVSHCAHWRAFRYRFTEVYFVFTPFTKHSPSAWHKIHLPTFSVHLVVGRSMETSLITMVYSCNPKWRQFLQSSDAYCQKYNSAWVALAQNAVCARWLAGFKMAARVREELTSLRRWLLLPLPRSSCCRWLSSQSLMSQPWAGLPSKLCSLSVPVVMTPLKAEPFCEGVWPHIGARLFISHHHY